MAPALEGRLHSLWNPLADVQFEFDADDHLD
jgi:hypothetical protein